MTATLEAPVVQTAPEQETVAPARAFVIKASLVGKFEKGQCLSEYSFPLGTDFDRLMLQGAIRPAMSNESAGTVVAADAVAKPGVSLTRQLGEAQETIIRLSNRIAKQDAELEQVKNAQGPNYDPERDEKMQAHFEKYRQTILVQEGKIKALTDEVNAYRQKLNDIGNNQSRRQK